MNFLCNELIGGTFFSDKCKRCLSFPPRQYYCTFPTSHNSITKRSFCKVCRMFMNVPECFKFSYTRADLWAKLLLVLLMTTTTTMITMKKKRRKRKLEKTHKIWLQFKTFTSSARNVRSSKMQFGKCYLLTMADFNENAATADDKNILSQSQS